MIYLDTHVVAWLYAGLVAKFSQPVKELINQNELHICQIVRLELQYLFEIQRLNVSADLIVADLSARIGLTLTERDFNAIVSHAQTCSWTREPLDRLIVANADLDRSILVTKDQNILNNYELARW